MLVDRMLADRQSRAAVELEFKRRRSKRVLHRGQSGGSLHSSWASSSSSPAFLSPVTSEIDRGRAISESRHGTTCVHCHRYTCQRLLYIWHRRSKCPALQVGDREPVISSASQPLTCMYGLLIYQGYGSHPTSYHPIHPPLTTVSTVHPTLRSCSPKAYFPESCCRHLRLPTLAFRTSQGLPFSLNYRSGQRYCCTPVVNRLHRVLKHAHSHLFPHKPPDLLLLPSLLLSYAQCPSSRRHMQPLMGLP